MLPARPLRLSAASIVTTLILAACGGSDDPASPTAAVAVSPSGAATGSSGAPAAAASPAPTAASSTIVDVAAADARFSSLVAALKFASNGDDLVTLLSGAGDFTVFAPTNDAFDALARELTGNPSATAADLLTPSNKALVRTVLQYHVLASRVPASAIVSGRVVEPASGDGTFFKIDTTGSAPVITDGRGRQATIVATDVAASNGVIHVIDRVILPADRTIVETAAALPAFSSLVAALQFASDNGDLVGLLSGPGPFTVFAPTNDAFDALARELTHDPAATAAALLTPANRALVRSVLQYHVVAGRVLAADVPLGVPIDPALAGTATFSIARVGDRLVITDARHRNATITATDVFTRNGVIHVIDRVILPPAH